MSSNTNNDDEEVVNVMLFKNDLSIMLDILQFTKVLTSDLAKQQQSKNFSVEDSVKLQKISQGASQLYKLLHHHMDIGEPESDTLN